MSLVHLLLELEVPIDDRFVAPASEREEALGPDLVPPVRLFDPRESLPDLPVRVPLDLLDDPRNRALLGNHRHQVDMVRLDPISAFNR